MRFQGALVTEQGVTFGIVVVKPHVLNERCEADRMRQSFGFVMRVPEVVLMVQDSCGTPTYYGRPDIARFLANVPVDAIPWSEYTLN